MRPGIEYAKVNRRQPQRLLKGMIADDMQAAQGSRCAAPYVPVKGKCGTCLELEVRHLEGRKHLPIFRLLEAA